MAASMAPGITVAIPSIPPRAAMLVRAVSSVMAQELPAAAISIAVDLQKQGAAATRDRALQAVQTQWTAFLDDDDQMLPEHLRILMDAADQSGADFLFSYYTVAGPDGTLMPHVDPLGNFGRVFDHAAPHQTTVTTLVRTELAQQVGFREFPEDGSLIEGQRRGEDFRFVEGCVAAGAKVLHVPQRTWIYSHHQANTSGLSSRW
jgi:glycosyltransferase involved in cell wall biosynthesis